MDRLRQNQPPVNIYNQYQITTTNMVPAYAPTVVSSAYSPDGAYQPGFTIPRSPRFVESPSDMVNNAQALIDSYLTTFFNDVQSQSEIGQMIYEEMKHNRGVSEMVKKLSEKLWQRLYDMESTKITIRVYLSSTLDCLDDLKRYNDRFNKVWKKMKNHIYRTGQTVAEQHPAYIRNVSIPMIAKVRYVLGNIFRYHEDIDYLKTLEEIMTMQIRVARNCIQELPVPKGSPLMSEFNYS